MVTGNTYMVVEMRPGSCLWSSLVYPVLALLDYVSRAHDIEIRRSSLRPSSVSQLSHTKCADIRSDVVFYICKIIKRHKEKKIISFCDFPQFSAKCDSMRAKYFKTLFFLEITAGSVKLLHFLPYGSHYFFFFFFNF